MKTWLEDNTLNERLRNSDYSKIVKLVDSNDPRYCFGIISACRGIDRSKKPVTQKTIDDNNNANKKNSKLLSHELNANWLSAMEVVGYYPEEDAGLVEETSWFVYALEEDEFKLKSILIELAKVFHQDSIIFIDAKNHRPRYIWTGDGKESDWIVEKNKAIMHFDFNQDSLDEVFTRVGTRNHGRRFQLKEVNEMSFSNNIATRMLYYKNPMILDYRKIDDSSYLDSFREAIAKYVCN